MGGSDYFWAIEITVVAVIVVMSLLIYSVRQNTLMLKRLFDHSADDADGSDNSENASTFNGEQAQQWFEKGEIKSLSRYCEGYIKDAPNSVHANWYYALSYYTQGEYETAREYFENVIRIDPLWRNGAGVYLQEIAEKIGHSNHHTVH